MQNVNVQTAQTFALNEGRNDKGGLLEQTVWQVAIDGAGKDGKPANGRLRLPRAIGPDQLESYLRSQPDHILLPLTLPKGVNPSVTIDGRTFTLSIGTRYYRVDALRAFFGIKPLVAKPAAPAVQDNSTPAKPAGKSKPVTV